MPATRILDPLFGPLQWELHGSGWGTWIDLPFFQDSGSQIPREPKEPAPARSPKSPEQLIAELQARKQQFQDAIDATPSEQKGSLLVLMAKDRMREIDDKIALLNSPIPRPERKAFDLVIDAPSAQPPTEEQREAWAQFTANMDATGPRILEQALAAYQRQRDARIHWWKQIYGPEDPLLPHVLPPISTPDEMLSFIRPWRFYLLSDPSNEQPPTVGIHFQCAWYWDGFGVRVCKGHISIGNDKFAKKLPKPAQSLQHPLFGTLHGDDDEWHGTFRWEPLRQFHDIGEWRNEVRNDPPKLPPFRFPSWNFIEGNFDLEIDLAWDEEEGFPEEAVEQFRLFTADLDRSAEQVLTAIAATYQRYVDRGRKSLDDPELADDVLPLINSVDGLRPLITFETLRVFESGASGGYAIGLFFQCSYDPEHALGVRWANGRVEEVGQADTSFS